MSKDITDIIYYISYLKTLNKYISQLLFKKFIDKKRICIFFFVFQGILQIWLQKIKRLQTQIL